MKAGPKRAVAVDPLRFAGWPGGVSGSIGEYLVTPRGKVRAGRTRTGPIGVISVPSAGLRLDSPPSPSAAWQRIPRLLEHPVIGKPGARIHGYDRIPDAAPSMWA